MSQAQTRILLEEFMWAEDGLNLGLTNLELPLFAYIYNRTYNGVADFYETDATTASVFRTTRPSINKAKKHLVEKGLIKQTGKKLLANGKYAIVYTAWTDAVIEVLKTYPSVNQSDIAESDVTKVNTRSVSEQMCCNESIHQISEFSTTQESIPTSELLKTHVDDDAHANRCAVTKVNTEGMIDGYVRSKEDSTLGDSSKSDLLDEKLEESFEALCSLSLKKVFGIKIDTTRKAYIEAVEAGYTPEQIEKAYMRYAERYKQDNPTTTQYAKQLIDWLTGGGGLKFHAGAPKGSPSPSSARMELEDRKALEDALYEANETYRFLVDSVRAIRAEKPDGGEGTQEWFDWMDRFSSAAFAASDFFREHEDEAMRARGAADAATPHRDDGTHALHADKRDEVM